VPARSRRRRPRGAARRRLFAEAGCARAATRPTLRTCAHAALPELARPDLPPVHRPAAPRHGRRLSDGRPDFLADGREWRTAPLWGLGLNAPSTAHRLLHDGRARGTAEAILWHGGEAEASRDAFRAMSASEREALIAFVESL
jgi:CxxC motif-containing protein (DUF1111 family)